MRAIATVALLLTVYFLAPMDRATNIGTVTELTLELLVLTVILAWQIRTISRSKTPGIRAVEALIFTIPFFILVFASTYFLIDHEQHVAFTQRLSRIDAIYFSTTVFTTVGFGDITARSEAARLVVTTQMILDLVVLGLVVRLVIHAAKIGRQRRGS